MCIRDSGDLVGCAIAIPWAEKSKRVLIQMLCYSMVALTGLCYLIVTIPESCAPVEEFCSEKIFLVSALFINRIFMSYSVALACIQVIELYPTLVRSMGLCFCLSVGRSLGGSPAGAILDLFKLLTGLNPMICFSAAALIGIISVAFLKETMNERLPDNIPELEEKKRHSRNNSSGSTNIADLKAPTNLIPSKVKFRSRGHSRSSSIQASLKSPDSSSYAQQVFNGAGLQFLINQ
eukprot:TRINITY_DN28553_c0_g2_i2.p1 TRINITY_DN28553_c0_g2~~TRINITY_DN28553_c0_g2_i2.p1  ORF type:complete len:235 (-),score=-1.05 TRINITY_DN28553_c0_g2_i2:193-897(-)